MLIQRKIANENSLVELVFPTRLRKLVELRQNGVRVGLYHDRVRQLRVFVNALYEFQRRVSLLFPQDAVQAQNYRIAHLRNVLFGHGKVLDWRCVVAGDAPGVQL